MNDQNTQAPHVTSHQLLVDEFIKVTKEDLTWPDGTSRPYFSVSTTKNSVSIIARNASGEFLVIEEYRHPTQKFLLSCPAGMLQDNENPLEGAKRELLEETGYAASRWEILGACYPLPGLFDQKMTIVLADDIYEVQKPMCESTELISHKLLPLQEVLALLILKEAVDGIFCSSLFYYLAKYK